LKTIIINHEIEKVIGIDYNPFTDSNTPTYEVEKWIEKIDLIKIHKKPKYYSNCKAIVSGDIVEFIEYEKSILYGCEAPFKGGKGSKHVLKTLSSTNKAKMALRRLINTNSCNTETKFITLTYAEDIFDIKKSKDDFKKFIKRWNYERHKLGQAPLKYVYVIEFQDLNRGGVIHFHCLFFELAFFKVQTLEMLWGHGRVDLKKMKSDNLGAYLVKYMSKAVNDERLIGVDLYGRSRGNLKVATEITNPL